MNVDTSGLPPEMQQRIAEIIEGAKQKAVAQPQPKQEAPQQTALAKPQPSLMDHTVALRQEVAAMRQEMHAIANVVDAVGQAVGQLYGMFHQQTQLTDQGTTYSQNFQQEQYVEESDY